MTFILGCFAIFASLSGALAGEIYGRKALVVMWGTGPELAAGLGELPIWLYVGSIAPAIVCYLLWGQISRGAVLLLPGVNAADMCAILWVGSFVAISDLRTRFVPDIVMVPFMLYGMLHGLPKTEAVASSVEAAAVVIILRYVVGAGALAVSILLPRLSIQRVYSVVADGDWLIAAACAAWVGFGHAFDLMLISALIPLLILVPGYLPGLRGPARSVASRLLDFAYLPHEGGDTRPSGMPLAGPLVLALLLEEILLHVAGGAYQPSSLIITFFRGH